MAKKVDKKSCFFIHIHHPYIYYSRLKETMSGDFFVLFFHQKAPTQPMIRSFPQLSNFLQNKSMNVSCWSSVSQIDSKKLIISFRLIYYLILYTDYVFTVCLPVKNTAPIETKADRKIAKSLRVISATLSIYQFHWHNWKYKKFSSSASFWKKLKAQ
jgi:hypothetical protein